MSLPSLAPFFESITPATTAFGLVCLAQMGDKTQLAVAGMAGTNPPLPVWLGATLALAITSAIGV